MSAFTDEEIDTMALAVQNERLGTPGAGWGLTDDYVKAEYRRVALAVAGPLAAKHAAEVARLTRERDVEATRADYWRARYEYGTYADSIAASETELSWLEKRDESEAKLRAMGLEPVRWEPMA